MIREPDLLGLLDGSVQREEQRAANRAAHRERRRVRPDTGQRLPAGKTWCGRCGQTVAEYELITSHDIGYLGCPVEHDPTWSRYPRRGDGKGFRGHGAVGYPGQSLTKDDLCDRWERAYIADCTCGHPWGLHAAAEGGGNWSEVGCLTYCGCKTYQQQ